MRRGTMTAAHVNEAKPKITRAMLYLAVLRALPDRRQRGYGAWMLAKHVAAQMRHIEPCYVPPLSGTMPEQMVREIVRALVARGFAERGPAHLVVEHRITPEGRWLRELLGEAIEGARP